MSGHLIVIGRDGRVQFIAADELLPFKRAMGPVCSARAAAVEPTGPNGSWEVEMPGGDKYGPFEKREDALRYERQMVEGRMLRGRLQSYEPEGATR